MNTGDLDYNMKQEGLASEVEIMERIIGSYEKAIFENIGQILSLAKMDLFTIDLRNTDESQFKINSCRKLIGRSIHDLRYITKQLSPQEVIEKGLAFSIEHELQRIKHSKSCETDFRLSGTVFRLDKEKELMAFSILQEILLDGLILQANKIVTRLHYSATGIRINIIHENKEVNFPLINALNDNIKLNNRLKLMGAELILNNAPGTGTILVTIKRSMNKVDS